MPGMLQPRQRDVEGRKGIQRAWLADVTKIYQD